MLNVHIYYWLFENNSKNIIIILDPIVIVSIVIVSVSMISIAIVLIAMISISMISIAMVLTKLLLTETSLVDMIPADTRVLSGEGVGGPLEFSNV